MIMTMYQEYMYVVGQLKDAFKLEVDVPHRDVHTFYHNKRPIFKLMFGTYAESKETCVVVSFHITISITDAIEWYKRILKIHPLIKVVETYIEDQNGETYLGEDAEYIRSFIQQREILNHWLDNRTEDEMKEAAAKKVVGKKRDYRKSYHSHSESERATIEFDLLKKPENTEDIH